MTLFEECKELLKADFDVASPEGQRRAYRYPLRGGVYPQFLAASRAGHPPGQNPHAQQLFHRLPQQRCQRLRHRPDKRLCAGSQKQITVPSGRLDGMVRSMPGSTIVGQKRLLM